MGALSYEHDLKYNKSRKADAKMRRFVQRYILLKVRRFEKDFSINLVRLFVSTLPIWEKHMVSGSD